MSAPHHTDERITVHHGDCLDVLRSDALGYPFELGYGPRLVADNSVDAVVTDPPYGLGFMGKEWDSGKSFVEREEAKSNHFDHVGGNHNPANSADQQRTRLRENAAFGAWCEEWARECLRVLKPGGHMLAFGGTRTWHRLSCAVEDAGFEVRDSIAWLYGSGFPKSMNKAITGTQLGHGSNSGAIRRATMGNEYEPSGVRGPRAGVTRRSDTGMANRDLPLTEDAEPWTGWGTALKPAFEPIVVGRKPLAGTVAVNVLTHGTGALNIDACRVGSDSTRRSNTAEMGYHGGNLASSYNTGSELGRWPANVVLDESQAAELDEQAPETGGAGRASGPSLRGATDATVAYGGRGGWDGEPAYYGDSGGASRFFYVAKADQSERVRVGGVAHPTVKPLDLMRWLVRLVSPPGGTVLEPFAGSGTTVEACILEGFRCVAIEREVDYLPLIRQRIARRLDPVAAVRGAGGDGGLFDLLAQEGPS
ncbi:site-specific DNA-methyltransferase [Nocardioides sp. ChNu-99]|uniref:DNA-methyltransferase n=1 Tax=Nocardioides sp. ChNu-99 TaxID=2839897 RepID=UPI002406E34B|nr:site-specific DNA-methyltransferase [Nocardioides sp. ChNu-99]MDF9718125.1 site-specific DNA-methyltransferase [Nocardioides sp. ChNu-99]